MDNRGGNKLGAEANPVDAARLILKHYVLRLYVTGSTPHSTRAITNIREFCEKYLGGRYDLEVIDISQNPALAEGEQIIAAPTLIKKLPLPLRRFIGDMSHTERILLGLDLHESNETISPAGNS
jgi:circadian clock protein KaiB